MPRYFLELAYKGTNYSGFQVQENANTIQAEIEKALHILFRQNFILTGSSRTDAGVHALQNFFHCDSELPLPAKIYSLNSLLPGDIIVKRIFAVPENSHCRFDAASREYRYYIYHTKNPFLSDRAYYYPYKLEINEMNRAALIVKAHKDFSSFSKRRTQVKTFLCSIQHSEWKLENDCIIYTVIANRFLRGMVRGLVGTMLKVGRKIITPEEFEAIILGKNSVNADFSAPPHGLFLAKINYDK